MKKLFQLLLAILLIGLVTEVGFQTHAHNNHRSELINYSIPLKTLKDSLANNASLYIIIDKSDYRLSVLAGTQVLKTYPVVFGGNPSDDKRMQGDECTPEGKFKVRSKYPHKTWSKFIWINYPTNESWEKHREAKQKGEIPESAKIGGEIGIHGVPKGYDTAIDFRQNWTLGCISLKNNDINDLYTCVFTGMDILIRQ